MFPFAFMMLDSTVMIPAAAYKQAYTALQPHLPANPDLPARTGRLDRPSLRGALVETLHTLGYATKKVSGGERNGRIKEDGLLLAGWCGHGGKDAALPVLHSLAGIARGRAVWAAQNPHPVFGASPVVFATFIRNNGLEEAPVADYTFGPPEPR